jgi:hypothetical protein
VTVPLDFERQREIASGSWQRACEEPALIERVAWDRWLWFFRCHDRVCIFFTEQKDICLSGQ